MLKSSIDKATGFEKRFENIGTVVFENPQAFANVNTPEELAALEKVSS